MVNHEVVRPFVEQMLGETLDVPSGETVGGLDPIQWTSWLCPPRVRGPSLEGRRTKEFDGFWMTATKQDSCQCGASFAHFLVA